jgi:hypothetical protein
MLIERLAKGAVAPALQVELSLQFTPLARG